MPSFLSIYRQIKPLARRLSWICPWNWSWIHQISMSLNGPFLGIVGKSGYLKCECHRKSLNSSHPPHQHRRNRTPSIEHFWSRISGAAYALASSYLLIGGSLTFSLFSCQNELNPYHQSVRQLASRHCSAPPWYSYSSHSYRQFWST